MFCLRSITCLKSGRTVRGRGERKWVPRVMTMELYHCLIGYGTVRQALQEWDCLWGQSVGSKPPHPEILVPVVVPKLSAVFKVYDIRHTFDTGSKPTFAWPSGLGNLLRAWSSWGVKCNWVWALWYDLERNGHSLVTKSRITSDTRSWDYSVFRLSIEVYHPKVCQATGDS
jgi:hypothetical protein